MAGGGAEPSHPANLRDPRLQPANNEQRSQYSRAANDNIAPAPRNNTNMARSQYSGAAHNNDGASTSSNANMAGRSNSNNNDANMAGRSNNANSAYFNGAAGIGPEQARRVVLGRQLVTVHGGARGTWNSGIGGASGLRVGGGAHTQQGGSQGGVEGGRQVRANGDGRGGLQIRIDGANAMASGVGQQANGGVGRHQQADGGADRGNVGVRGRGREDIECNVARILR